MMSLGRHIFILVPVWNASTDEEVQDFLGDHPYIDFYSENMQR